MRKKVLSICLACLSLSSLILSSCKDTPKDTSVGLNDVTIWGMPSTEKVYQNIDKDSAYYTAYKTEAKVDITMAKGEYEGSQIIISADKDASYDVVSGELICGENKILQENVEVFAQKYINVSANHDTSTNMPIAKYPDALVPMANLKAVGENVVKKGENQGIYIRVQTPINQPAGVYTGNLTVKIGEDTTSVPVKVTVADVVVSEENHLKSVFLNGWSFFEGELDNTQEMYDLYNEALFEYRLCSGTLYYGKDHVQDISTPEKIRTWVEKAYTYMQNPKCSTINMPYQSDGANILAPKMKEVLKAIVDYSIEKDYNMFDKLVWYGGFIDEPRGNGIMEKARTVCETFNQTKVEFAQSIENDATITCEWKAELIESIKNIPNIVTEYYDEQMASSNTTFCPLFQYYDSEGLRAQYEDQAQQWWYGCVQPRAPYPTYHIDDTWLSARLISWMQAEYDIVGNLFWATDVYAKYNTTGKYQSIEEYYEGGASRFPAVNGDGFLFYPGKKYGVEGPLGSMRLEAIRDGMEEYEIMYSIKQNYETVNASLTDKTLNFKQFVNSLANNMYSGTVVSVTTEEFNEARASLFEVARLSAETGFGVIEYSDNGFGTKTYQFVVQKDWTVKYNGATLNPMETQDEYAIYSVEKKLDNVNNSLNFTFEKGGESYDYNVNLGGQVVSKMGSELSTADIIEKTIVPITEVDGTGLKVTLPAVTDPDTIEQSFVMTRSNLSAINTNTGKIVLHITYEGTDNAKLTLNGKFAGSRINSELTVVELKQGDNQIVIDLSTRNMTESSLLESLIFGFYKQEDDLQIAQRVLTIKSIVFYGK